ncbi:MAG: hypothetical protein LC800_15600 [Acidobacteria bacterium]|nr:hypothetical protein [Acidobacteriota bacterium]
MSDLEVFCRQVRSRSNDHRRAIELLQLDGPPSQIISILRQELDSMIRVIYLLSISDMAYREQLIKASTEGQRWRHKDVKKLVTDRDMVNLANNLQGWVESVYRFGCAFIHLSIFHDYRERDPMDAITSEERRDILHHIRTYHGGPEQVDPKFNDLLPYLPMVFDKIASNLEFHLADLEAGRVI